MNRFWRDDALAALVRTVKDSPYSVEENTAWLYLQGVVVLPPDHPLRTGKESEPMFDAARTAFNAAIKNWHWDMAFRIALRAALTVLRTP